MSKKTALQRLALVYALVLLGAASLNYIPGLTDASGLAFGVFALDPYDDLLHLFSALWALGAGLRSHSAARYFAVIFGAAYLLDGVLGMFTGYGFLDLGILTNESLGARFDLFRWLANLPHLGLGGIALLAGLKARA